MESILMMSLYQINQTSTTIVPLKLGSLVGKQVSELNLKNGDLLYINYGGALATPSASTQGGSAPINSVRSNSTTTTTPTSASTSIPISKVSAHGPLNVDQLPVDDELDKLDGMIQRPISSMCRHGSKGMCEYCSPLSPWDESYRKEHSIKHISYHAYLNQQMAKFNKNWHLHILHHWTTPIMQ